jgi:hypothetical protein
MFQTASIVFMVAALSAVPMFAQYEEFRSDVSVQGSGSFTKESTKDGISRMPRRAGRLDKLPFLLQSASRVWSGLWLQAQHGTLLALYRDQRREYVLA